jgi:hypothetical protein
MFKDHGGSQQVSHDSRSGDWGRGADQVCGRRKSPTAQWEAGKVELSQLLQGPGGCLVDAGEEGVGGAGETVWCRV